jgi:hypothetical protein
MLPNVKSMYQTHVFFFTGIHDNNSLPGTNKDIEQTTQLRLS